MTTTATLETQPQRLENDDVLEDPFIDPIQDKENKIWKFCDFCGLHIKGQDHHCPWVGKCVGKGNMTQFWIFMTFASMDFIYVLLSMIMIPHTKQNQNA